MFEVTLLKHSFSCLKFQIGVDIFIKCNSLILSFFIFNLFFFTLSWPNITPRDVPWISKDRPQLNFRYLRLVGFPAIFLVVAKILFLVYNWWKLCKRLNVKPWYGLFNTLFPIYFLKKASIKFSLYSGKWKCSTRVQVMFLVLSQIFMIRKKILWTYLIFNIKLQLNWHFKSVNQGDEKRLQEVLH